ncbi:similar to Saccharomyces cerevisiae YGR070W ROM1 GDP/GTP exchange protein (GEP) for Rho1p [Maudiozyma saulgeensis]|uniref:Similar to Saccharomyces cerevisiae YGR070W ROM1 GDP/GTP exchange protein (GEP) for Rho1p n=1 Tax=Maudiozyma saulgeensis TaxID=1789683 RepID=A0A1X7QZ17_9SACH|nr:similar to Saccharomyces cerevisiae YGR070W ROM1 GDP/GTP exchange protein (GEP) for Rho1p [Kazachstania saulgeensis]
MVGVTDSSKRYDLYSEIYGTKRFEDSFKSNDEEITANDLLKICDFDNLLIGDITNDLIENRTREVKQSGTEDTSFILSQKTAIKNVPDTQSLSSADNTPVTSPRKIGTRNDNTPMGLKHPQLNSTSNNPFSTNKKKNDNDQQNVRNMYSSTASLTGSTHTLQGKNSINQKLQSQGPTEDSHEQMQNISVKKNTLPKKKPSLPHLALAGLKKQSSFSSPSNTPTQKKSPFQGFGLFHRSTSRDFQDIGDSSQHSPRIPQQNYEILSNGTIKDKESNNNDNKRLTPTSSSLSLNSSALKSLATNFQSRRSSQKFDNKNSTEVGTNPFLDNPSSPLATSQNAFGYSDNNNGHPNSAQHCQNNQIVGLGIKTRSSSASLVSKRFTSSSGSSLPYHQRQSSVHQGHKNHYRRSSFTPPSSTVSAMKQNSHARSHSVKKPHVYPALLSKVAQNFRAMIRLGEYKKDGLLYRDAFTGQHAVDILCAMIRTSDRNLALLLGRSLDAQKLFHDVVYEHRLRDSPFEIYEFTDNARFIGSGKPTHDPLMMMSNPSTQTSFVRTSNQGLNMSSSTSSLSSYQTSSTSLSGMPSNGRMSQQTFPSSVSSSSHPNQEVTPKTTNVNGVFTLLSECYSPTCSRDKLCYSISCPRRLEQQARLNLKPNGGLKRNISMALDDDEEEKPSWTSSVSEDIWKDLPKKEIKRQEAIYEVYITEKNFVKSLEVTRDTFMKTLAETNIIPADIRKNFIRHVFAHINDIYSVNRRFLEALSDRQKSSPVVRGIGDIILRFVPFFEPFISYVASRPYAKYLIETQRSVNPYFARFDDDMMSSSLRHGIDSFLSQGVSRPGRYMLLVREILKSSNPDKDKRDMEALERAGESLKTFMKRIDKASGAAQDRHDVKLLKQKILFKNEYVNMGLNDEKRKIVHEGILSRKETGKSDATVSGDIQFYLLDNMLLFLKAKAVNKWHQHKVFQRPIPLPLLFVSPSEDMPPLRKYIGSSPASSGSVVKPEYNATNPKNALTFLYYGAKQRYQVTLYAPQYAGLQTLIDKIKQEQQRIIDETSMINITKMSDKFFDYSNKINSVTSCDGGRKLLIATNSGLYVGKIKRKDAKIQETIDDKSANNGGGLTSQTTFFSTPTLLVQKNNIVQIAVLEEFKSILLLVDKKLYSCPLQLLDVEGNATSYFKKHSKELINHVNFFSEGDCNGKRLIVTAHNSSHSIKFFELEHPLLSSGNGASNKKSLKRKITEVVFDSEPVSISFLKANLCVGCKKGFQIVSITQNAHESLLDPADTSLEFALRDTLKPMAIYRVGNMFLLCYTEFAFFVNNQGWRKKDSHIIYWEGEPQKFAIWYPYILAFDNNFIEIRKIESGELVRCILGDKIRLLQSNTQEILYAYEDLRGFDTVASLDFWG